MPESQNIEYKPNWREDYLKWVCGFANAEGGVLFIGRDDGGKVVGVKDASKLLEDIPNQVRDMLGIVVDVNLRTEGMLSYLEIRVESYPNPISFQGVYYVRSGSTNQRLKGSALDRFLLRKYGRTWDGVPLPGITITDLDPAGLKRFRSQAARSKRLDAAVLEESNAGLIEKLRLREGDYLKRAAALLFHPDPVRFFTGAAVKIGYFASESDLRYHDEIEGDLFTQVSKTMELLLTKYLKALISYEGIQRVESYPMPESALREAVLNAVVHRDYAVPAPIQIRVYEDRLKIWNPGELPDDWTEARLLEPHSSQPYNPDIANAFFRAGEIESWGRGIQRIFDACREAGTPEPRLQVQGREFWFEFPFPATTQKREGTTQKDEETAQETREKASEKASEKTSEKIVRMMMKNSEVTIRDMSTEIGVTDRSIERNIGRLQKRGRIRRVGSDRGGYWEVLE